MKKLCLSLALAVALLGLGASALAYETHTGPAGLVKNVKERSYGGYTLFSVLNNKTTYLIDSEGNVVHTWASKYLPGLYSELMPDGRLIRQGQIVPAGDRKIYPSGAGGILEIIDWDGNVVWDFQVYNDRQLSHHGFSVMDNGNILILAAENFSPEEILAKGRKPGTFKPYTTKDAITGKEITYDKFILDYVIEVNPATKEIVWEWHAFDNIGEGPDQLDINYILPSPIGAFSSTYDWSHWNTVHQMPGTNQIIVNSRNFSEFYLVDKDTKKIVYRWGNPSASKQGAAPTWYNNGDQKVFGLHNPHPLPNGNILLFDNGSEKADGNRSAVMEVNPKTNKVEWQYAARTPNSFYSFRQSSAQKLPNDNYFVTSTQHGHLFEVTPDRKIVWEFINPIVKQDTAVCFIEDEVATQNQIHRAYRYGTDYPGLQGKDLSPKGKINPGCPDWTTLLTAMPGK